MLLTGAGGLLVVVFVFVIYPSFVFPAFSFSLSLSLLDNTEILLIGTKSHFNEYLKYILKNFL